MQRTFVLVLVAVLVRVRVAVPLREGIAGTRVLVAVPVGRPVPVADRDGV